ncbi:MAG: SET domain protein, partial [uncultured Gemmatimonadaceae bacterium]
EPARQGAVLRDPEEQDPGPRRVRHAPHPRRHAHHRVHRRARHAGRGEPPLRGRRDGAPPHVPLRGGRRPGDRRRGGGQRVALHQPLVCAQLPGGERGRAHLRRGPHDDRAGHRAAVRLRVRAHPGQRQPGERGALRLSVRCAELPRLDPRAAAQDTRAPEDRGEAGNGATDEATGGEEGAAEAERGGGAGEGEACGREVGGQVGQVRQVGQAGPRPVGPAV